ncbi:glycerol-3-phosphate dehydrogenase [Aliiroseovarius sp. 2305UL8-7]|uniref:glycerol-3-phosphate dehydrogenase n=1 Tax=Aliiroseovarius conchicola TaxID=3121637 RepID=UPI003528C2AC
MTQPDTDISDIFIIGGGINGCGIARDAAGRGLSVTLAEMNDLAWATSSSSTKLFHGGLRYLEYFEFRLVREALIERETLLRAMPHISWPMRFVLPYHKDMRFEGDTPTSKLLTMVMPWMRGRRPAWLIRLGLFLYDNLGGRKILPGTETRSLVDTAEGAPLNNKFTTAYEYSDCWVEDARLVVLNARDAEARGATILTRTKVTKTTRHADHWIIETQQAENGPVTTHKARVLVNAAGPWVGDVIDGVLDIETTERVRLVRGSHIVTPKLFEHDKAYFFQGEDGRIIFAIPYETDFTLIGTTDAAHDDAENTPACTDDEKRYLIDFANQYFARQITQDDVVWTYSGVRPLYDDGASSATAATREYVLKLNDAKGAPVLNIFGGKITTYRRLAENALVKVAPLLGTNKGQWTAGVPLPGGDFPVDGVEALQEKLRHDYPFLTDRWSQRLIKAYGTDSWQILSSAKVAEDLGTDFGATLTEQEVRWLIDNEYVTRAEDIIWRRSKLGLRLQTGEVEVLDNWISRNL